MQVLYVHVLNTSAAYGKRTGSKLRTQEYYEFQERNTNMLSSSMSTNSRFGRDSGLSAETRRQVTSEPIVLVILNPKSTRHEVARAGGFVKFWRFLQKRALFHRLPRRARASNCTRHTLGFYKHALASIRKSTGSEFVLSKACTFKIVQNYGLCCPTLVLCCILRVEFVMSP